MTESPNQTATPPQNPSGADALSRLHKMSRTAGAGSQDYVAINAVAVTSVLFALASPLVIVFGWTLLIIPVTAIVLAIVAIRQVVGSNGTQTGKALAWISLLIAVGSSGFYLTQETLAITRSRSDEMQINTLIEQVGTDLSKQNFATAYGQFSTKFHETATLEAFSKKWLAFFASPFYGPVKSMTGNQNVGFDKEGDGTQIAATYAIIKREKVAQDERQLLRFRKVDGHWVIDQFGDYFQEAPPPIPGQLSGPNGVGGAR
jgi:hypothetical protein